MKLVTSVCAVIVPVDEERAMEDGSRRAEDRADGEKDEAV